METKKGNRKAITPILAELILLSITLIIGAAFTGFVFGMIGSFTSTARVEVSSSTIVHGTAGVAAGSTILALNTGTSNVYANSLTLTWGGQTCTVEIEGGPITVTAGATQGISIPLTAASGSCAGVPSLQDESFSGVLLLSSDGQIPFAGQFR
jgi:FlaG/FlaF family flagellin (archaellin)